MTKLKTLDEHNQRRRDAHGPRGSRAPVFNGIACPKCSRELVDTNPTTVLTTDPPQKDVYCPGNECGFRGYRLA